MPALDTVRVRYQLPLDVDVDLRSGRVVGVSPQAPYPDEAAVAVVLDEGYEFRGPAPRELAAAAYDAVGEQVLVVDVDPARFAVEVVPTEPVA